MLYCYRCGVSIEERLPACPLCHTPVPEGAMVTGHGTYPETPNEDVAISLRRRLIGWSTGTALCAVPVFIVTVVDLMLSHHLTWSLWPSASLFFSFVLLTMAFFTRTTPSLLVNAGIAISLFLAGLDWIPDHHFNWIIPLGLPLTIVSMLFFVPMHVVKKLGAPVAVGSFFLSAGILSVAVDAIITGWMGHVHLCWSLIVNAAVLPIGAGILFFDRVLKRSLVVQKFFHV